MYTIWFWLPNSNVQLRVDIPGQSTDLSLAQQVWDTLKTGGFWMISARP